MFNNFESQKNEDSSSYCYQEKEPTILKKLNLEKSQIQIFITFLLIEKNEDINNNIEEEEKYK